MQHLPSSRMPAAPTSRSQYGVSLIEALVALAVMAFGILGVIGVQTTLRVNGDIAKQRAEAVRIAQEAVEDSRAFTALTLPLPAGHTASFAQIASAPASTVPGTASNTTFSLSRTVVADAAPLSKTLQVKVEWADRSSTTPNQYVELTTRVAGILPELSGSLSIASRSLNNQQLGGRNTAIPAGAIVDPTDPTQSSFAPPGAPAGVTWVFSNTTGLITSLCNPFPGSCTPTSATLLSGFVRFALGLFPAPSSTDSESPTSPTPAFPFTFDVEVVTTSPVATINCYEQPSAAFVAYYCAVPLPTIPPSQWSGQSRLVGLTTAPSVASGASASSYRVCRYTPGANNAASVSNLQHPLNYSAVATSLPNQNFLLIRAGDGLTVFACPGDDISTDFINGNTLPHQPAS
jgi:Tfp pilus assembly protein PilV